LYSYKFEGTGVRTQFCTDINGFILYVSSSKYSDCLAFDGGYYYYIERFIE
ncbi:hypothetical protein BC941DRAFT_328673, partial [Chlamydoabsidia padenii]